MTTIEKASFDAKLSDAFWGGDRTQRELRLSPEECCYLQERCPQAVLTPLSPSGGGKTWYQVRLPAPQ